MAVAVRVQTAAVAEPDLEYLRRREPPCVVLLQEDFSILSVGPRFTTFCAELGCSQPQPNLLPALFQAIVGDLLASRQNVRVDAAAAVRVTVLQGPPGAPLAVVFERTCLRTPIESASRRFGLTAREGEVLRLVLRGLSARDIAVQLRIARNTVAEHFKHLGQKIGAHNRAELVARVLGWNEP